MLDEVCRCRELEAVASSGSVREHFPATEGLGKCVDRKDFDGPVAQGDLPQIDDGCPLDDAFGERDLQGLTVLRSPTFGGLDLDPAAA
jgi:hypothetical protein